MTLPSKKKYDHRIEILWAELLWDDKTLDRMIADAERRLAALRAAKLHRLTAPKFTERAKRRSRYVLGLGYGKRR